MILAELAGGVTERLEQLRDGRVFGANTDVGAGHSYLGEAGADWVLVGDECGSAGGAALLAVIVGERHAFIADPINIRRAVAHLTAVVVADIPPANVVT